MLCALFNHNFAQCNHCKKHRKIKPALLGHHKMFVKSTPEVTQFFILWGASSTRPRSLGLLGYLQSTFTQSTYRSFTTFFTLKMRNFFPVKFSSITQLCLTEHFHKNDRNLKNDVFRWKIPKSCFLTSFRGKSRSKAATRIFAENLSHFLSKITFKNM